MAQTNLLERRLSLRETLFYREAMADNYSWPIPRSITSGMWAGFQRRPE
jgi:hypothetical protein